ncbi:MAG: sn-glycerol-3-phosphate ABC transporter ATP-binding protein UgpC [Calditrichaeota bacterium]|nr:sn-glycerol-3-phosphate ABC transporter ATP-binding protein UgpC [Calditrichota bacterium]RQW06055.1 MAG: sn-glycerol-3-phosphate ABC transporter ATP-binding protein UgpC [Calditrichota bacterium]
MASVQMKKVSKIYDGKVTAIKDADIFIEDRDFVVLVGPSGCGKSTLLRMVAGLEEISSGEIYIDDKLVNEVAPKDRDIAMVFQNYALYPHMTVFDNMAFGLKLRKFPKEEIRERVSEAARILDIEKLLDRKPKALSGGQRQRVALGRAIVRKPKVFLFDEPLSNLDAKLRVQMRIEINRLHHKLQTTMIYVTHDQVEAMTMGDRIVVLKDGLIQQVDSPLKLYNDPVNRFVAGFIGSPSMNFIEGELVRNGNLQFKSKIFNFDIPEEISKKLRESTGKEVILGVRPEHLYDVSLATDKELSTPQKIQVDVVEPIGNEIFVYFSEGSQSYCMRMSPDKLHEAGEKIGIGIDLKKVFFFDAATEERIG